MLDNTLNQPTKFRAKNWVEINDESWGTYDEVDQIRLKTSMVRSSICDFSSACILVKATVTVANTEAAAANKFNERLIFKSYAVFVKCLSRINNTAVDDAKDIDLVMPMCNLVEYSDKYSKTSGILWQYCRDERAVDAIDAITDFKEANATRLLKR